MGNIISATEHGSVSTWASLDAKGSLGRRSGASVSLCCFAQVISCHSRFAWTSLRAERSEATSHGWNMWTMAECESGGTMQSMQKWQLSPRQLAEADEDDSPTASDKEATWDNELEWHIQRPHDVAWRDLVAYYPGEIYQGILIPQITVYWKKKCKQANE